MSYGVKFVLDNGKVYSSDSIPATFYETISIAGASTGSKAYPELAGFTLVVGTIKQSNVSATENLSDHSVAYDLGYPVLTWFPTRYGAASTQTFLVFAR
jgi:hypothetical protein